MVKGGWAAGFDMPNNPGHHTNSVERLEEKHDLYRAKSLIPLGAYAGAQPEYNNEDQLPEMIKKAAGTKFYSSPTTGMTQKHGARDFEPQVAILHQADPRKPIMVHASPHNVEDFIGLVAVDYEHPLHICHVNNPADVIVINKYKNRGHPVTCGVCVHHLVLDTLDAETRGPFAEMVPPLAREIDAEQLMFDLADGAIDVIETDHAPHSYEAKMATEEDGAHCSGVPSAQHSLPVLFYRAKRDSQKGAGKGRLTMERIADGASTQPKRIMGLRFSKNTKVTWNMETWRIEREDWHVESGAGWTPFLGMLAVGKVTEVTINGITVFRNNTFTGNRAAKVISRKGALV